MTKTGWIAALAILLWSSAAMAEDAPILKTQKDKENYCIGVAVARNFKRQGFSVDQEFVIRGMKDALSGGNLLMTEKEMRDTMASLQAEARRTQRAAIRLASEENRKKGEAFQAANAKKDGVVSLPSGLQYRALKAGDGPRPTDESSVVVRYRGLRIDGSEFDTTGPAGRAAVLKGWEGMTPGMREALKLMPAGSKWEICVPPSLAYGERGVGFDIGPNETLVYEVELLSVK